MPLWYRSVCFFPLNEKQARMGLFVKKVCASFICLICSEREGEGSISIPHWSPWVRGPIFFSTSTMVVPNHAISPLTKKQTPWWSSPSPTGPLISLSHGDGRWAPLIVDVWWTPLELTRHVIEHMFHITVVGVPSRYASVSLRGFRPRWHCLVSLGIYA
jgi:hypothetical protein